MFIGFSKGLLKITGRRKGLNNLFEIKNESDGTHHFKRITNWKEYRKTQYV